MDLRNLNILLDQHWSDLVTYYIKPTLDDMLGKPIQLTALKIPVSGGAIPPGVFLETELRLENHSSPAWSELPAPGFELFPGNGNVGTTVFAAPRTTPTGQKPSWGVTFSADVVATGLGKLGRQTIKVDGFQLRVLLDLSDVTATGELTTDPNTGAVKFPQLRAIGISPTVNITLTGVMDAKVSLNTQFKERVSGVEREFYVDIKTIAVLHNLPVVGTVTADFTGELIINPANGLTMRLKGSAKATVAGIKIGTFFIDTPVTLPLDLLGGTAQVPFRWGEGLPQTITTNADTHPFIPIANEVEDRLLKWHNPFRLRPRYGDLPRLLEAIDTRHLLQDYPHIPTGAPEAVKFYGAGDAAIWTGHLLAAEGFRFGAARKRGDGNQMQEARDQATRVLKVISLMLDIPQQFTANKALRGLPCRAVLPKDMAAMSQEWSKEGCEYSMLPDDGNPASVKNRKNYYPAVSIPVDGRTEEWIAKGRDEDPPSRDSLTGLLLGLAVTVKLFREDTANRDSQAVATKAGEEITHIIRYLIKNNWNLPSGRGELTPGQAPPKTYIKTTYAFFFDYILAILAMGKMVEDNPEGEFTKEYDRVSKAVAKNGWLTLWADCCNPLTSYYKFNLHHAAVGMLNWLTPKDDPSRGAYERMFSLLRQATGHHRNAYFHLLYVLGSQKPGDTLKKPAPASIFPPGTGRVATLKDEIRHTLYEWTLRLDPARNIVGPSGLPLSLSHDLRFYRELFKKKEATTIGGGAGEVLSKSPLMCYDRHGAGLDFMWQRDPFFCGIASDGSNILRQGRGDMRGRTVVEAPGVDYLLACWMADYLEIFEP